MDLTNATTAAGLKFHRFHEQFSHVIKVNAIGLILLGREVENGVTERDLAKAIAEKNWRNLWGGMPAWNEPMELIALARHGLGSYGVVNAFSAFDVFLDESEAEAASWRSFTNQAPPETKSDNSLQDPDDSIEADRLWKLLDREDIKIMHQETIKPIYTYYRLSRNCVVHRNSRASSALAKVSGSKDLELAVKKWKSLARHKTELPLKKMKTDSVIEFHHEHAIFASDLLRRIALAINTVMLNRFGPEGMIYLIAKQHILSGQPLPTDQLCRDCYSYIRWKLTFHLQNPKFEKTVVSKILRSQGIAKECYWNYDGFLKKARGNKTKSR